MKREERVKMQVGVLIELAMEILENNYDMGIVNDDNAAYITMSNLHSALEELEYLDDDCLKKN